MFCQIPTITNSSSQLDSAFVKKLLQFLDFPFLVFVFVFWQRSTITESTNSAGLVFWGKKMHPGCYCYLSIQMGIRFLERFPFMIQENATPVCHCYSSIQIRIRLHWRFLQRFPFTIWENCLFSLQHKLRIDFNSTSKFPCCVISALSWDRNENPSKDKLIRAINQLSTRQVALTTNILRKILSSRRAINYFQPQLDLIQSRHVSIFS